MAGEPCRYKSQGHISPNIPASTAFPPTLALCKLELLLCFETGQLAKLILNFQMTYHSLSVKREFLKVSLNNSHFESLAEFSQKQRTFVILLQSLLSLSHHRFLLKHQIQPQLWVKPIQKYEQ